MTYLLFHGRHIAHTSFQERYLDEVLRTDVSRLETVGGPAPQGPISHIVFAVTSANQSNSRFNPLPLYLRAIAVDRFMAKLSAAHGVQFSVVPVPHFDPTDRYVAYLLKAVQESSGIDLRPHNTVALSSTPGLIELYEREGFSVLPAEYDVKARQYHSAIPMNIVERLAGAAGRWEDDAALVPMLAASTRELWRDYPVIPAMIREIWAEPLLTEYGSLTETRNYSTYAAGMGHTELLDLKYQDIKGAIVPGRIADEGCADGALLTRLAADFPDSDLIGIEITSEFLARCFERQRAGEFGGAFVFFHQRNLMHPLFADATIDTAICNSTIHEIWSYGDGQPSVDAYLELKFRQLRGRGRLIIRDVVGPEEKEEVVYLHLSREDGRNDGLFDVPADDPGFPAHIASLSTEARFYRFAQDYLGRMRAAGKRGPETKVRFAEEAIGGKKYFVLRLKDAVEFMTKKDYTDNFISELNEEFAFFSFSDWKRILERHGFRVLEGAGESRVYTNPWIVEHRFVGKVSLFRKDGEALAPVEYPPTNMVLVAEKPAQ